MADDWDTNDNPIPSSPDELVLSYNDNCIAAEQAALLFLGTEIGLDHMPLINVPTLRDLVKGDFYILLRRAKDYFYDPIENALFLVVLTDYVTCAVRNVQLFDIFLKKKDVPRGIPCLLTYMDSSWNKLFRLLNTDYDMTVEQLRCLVSSFKRAINRLPTKLYQNCFCQSLNAGTEQLYYADLLEGHKNAKRQRLESKQQNQSDEDQLSYTSIKNCETPKYALDKTLKELYLSQKLSDMDPVISRTVSKVKKSNPSRPTTSKPTSNEVTDTQENTIVVPETDVPKPKKKKFSSDITKYMSRPNTEKKDPVNTTSPLRVIEKTVLEATSKENVQVVPDVDKRAITPPFTTVPDNPAKSSLVTPDDQPTIINLCSPMKIMPVTGAKRLPVTVDGKRNAFAILMQQLPGTAPKPKRNAFAVMMQRSKENSKRKALFPLTQGGATV